MKEFADKIKDFTGTPTERITQSANQPESKKFWSNEEKQQSKKDEK